MKRRALARIGPLIALGFLAGCAVDFRTREKEPSTRPNWHGRLAMQVEANPDDAMSQPQSFAAAFELIGDSSAGELTFFTPVGSTAAAIRWDTTQARLEFKGEARTYSGLALLIQDLLGTAVPTNALFSWLAGRDEPADGWQVDLGRFADGKIAAQRLSPQPRARLRLVLEP